MNTFSLFSHPFYVTAKPVGSHCNLACDYCYYLEKKKFYPNTSRQLMDDELLERFIAQYIGSQTSDTVFFTWHGGEALMRPLSFYKKVVTLQEKYAGGKHVENSLQTNGILLNDEWCRFFKAQNWLIGISIDGPQEFHDEYRRSRTGRPSFHQVMRGIKLLRNHGVEWNALAVVNDYNVDYPLEFYHFFKELECRYLQFTPIVERLSPHTDGTRLSAPSEAGNEVRLAPFSVSPDKWGTFLCTIFNEWVRNDVGTVFVQLFDATLANHVGQSPGLCTLAPRCGHAAALEFNGDLYACDHFVFPEYKIGNIRKNTLLELMYSERQKAFGMAKQESLPSQCKRCSVRTLCNGECPKNRFVHTAEGEPGLNYLCQGYYRFFNHVLPYMDFMKAELEAGRAPANIMQALKAVNSCSSLSFTKT